MIMGYTVFGQSPAGLSVGFDVMKVIPVFFNSGYMLEPSLIYTSRSNIIIDLAAGFTNVKKDTVYNNATYFNKGYYLRLDAGGMVLKDPGRFKQYYIMAGLVYSDFTERVNARFYDGYHYYSDAFTTLEQSNRLVSLEIQPGYRLPLMNSRFSVNFQGRFSWVITEYSQEKFPVYLVPGVGYVATGKDNVDSSDISAGASIRIVYKLLAINN